MTYGTENSLAETPPTSVYAIGNNDGRWNEFKTSQQVAMGWNGYNVDLHAGTRITNT